MSLRTYDSKLRREVILGVLREHPLSTSVEISRHLLAETGGAPALVTGAVFIPAHKVYADLRALEAKGLVWRHQSPAMRSISWQVPW